MIKKKKILMISYFFPPTNAIGALRVGKLAKYLVDFGWEPWVLTLEEGLFNIFEDLRVEIDPQHVIRADLGCFFTAMALKRKSSNQQAAVIDSAKITSRHTLKQRIWVRLSALLSSVRFPDRALPWYWPALKKGNALMKNQQFDAIFSSYGPPGSHVVASVLARYHHVPWIADFRDLWTQNHIEIRGKFFHWLEECFEKWTMQPCHGMTTVSLPLKRQLEELHHKPVVVIPNGFDHEDYPTDTVAPTDTPGVNIVYTGMLYPGKRDPSILFQAIKELKNEGFITSNSIQFEFYGSDPQQVVTLAAQHSVADLVSAFPRIPHAAVIQKQINATILLLLEWSDPKAKGVYTGKVFEYLGAKRPILAVGPEGGVIEALLQETATGVLVSTVDGAKATFKEWFEARLKTGAIPYSADLLAINRYSRRAQAETLAQVLNSIP